MKEFSICIFDNKKAFDFANLPKSCEVIYSNSSDNRDFISLDKEYIDETDFRNECLKRASGKYILWLNEETKFEEDLLEDYKEIIEEFDVDIVYPNEILMENENEKIKKHRDWFEIEKEMLSSLNFENDLLKWGVLTKKESFKEFEKKYKDDSFYGYIYKNLENLSLKLSSESYIERKVEDK